MEPKCCRLFDDEVVRNIMVSTGIAVMGYLRERDGADEEEICEFVDANAEMIIANTLADMEEDGGEGGNIEEGPDV